MAAYSYQLLEALKEHFDSRSLSFSVCALEDEETDNLLYPDDVRYKLNTSDEEACRRIAQLINHDRSIQAVCIQHRFGLWGGGLWGENIKLFLETLDKPVAIAFHNVLPEPDEALQALVSSMSERAELLTVQAPYYAAQLVEHYGVAEKKVKIIPPGAPVVPPFSKEALKSKYKLEGMLVLTSFGFLRRSKGIEFVLEAVDQLWQEHPELVYLILGKTHPTAARFEGERYRIQLKDLIFKKGLQKHVRFINRHLSQQELQEFMCLSDVYLHGSKTNLSSLVLANSCTTPTISALSPITEDLLPKHGLMADFQDPQSIAKAVREALTATHMFQEWEQREDLVSHPYLWPNVALAYQEVFATLVPMHVRYKLPDLKPDHLYRLTTSVGLLTIDKQTNPLSVQSYRLEDNAKALIAALLWYRCDGTHELLLLMLMRRYLTAIRKCQQADGTFLSQLDEQGDYMPEREKRFSEDSSMQAMWALSKLIKRNEELPNDMPALAQRLFLKGMPQMAHVSSLRGIAFAIKALYQYQEAVGKEAAAPLIATLAGRLQTAYAAIATKDFPWFEPELGLGSSLLSEAMLLAWQATGQVAFKTIAHRSFRFLLSRMFIESAPAAEAQELPFMSEERFAFSNRPLEVCYTVMSLNLFYQQTGDQLYVDKMFAAFSWFIGNNELHQTLYNPATGGCYEGIKNGRICQHQGAEPLVAYLLSRLTLERYTLQAFIQKQTAPERKSGALHGVETMPDRPSMASGQVKVLAN